MLGVIIAALFLGGAFASSNITDFKDSTALATQRYLYNTDATFLNTGAENRLTDQTTVKTSHDSHSKKDDKTSSEDRSVSRDFETDLNVNKTLILNCFLKGEELHFGANKGEVNVHIPSDETNTFRYKDVCKLRLTAPLDHVWKIFFTTFASINNDFLFEMFYTKPKLNRLELFHFLYSFTFPTYSATNEVIFQLTNFANHSPSPSLSLVMTFVSIPASSIPQLFLHEESPHRGYILTPAAAGVKSSTMESLKTIEVPEYHAVMLSYETTTESAGHISFILNTVNVYTEISSNIVMKSDIKSYQRIVPSLYSADKIHILFIKSEKIVTSGKLQYSFHNKSTLPQQMANGQWNCSVPFLSDFRQHFSCNLEPECLKGEDEASCFYTTAKCGEGFFAAGDSCFAYLTPDRDTSWLEAASMCSRVGGRLASLNTQEEWEDVVSLVSTSLFVGHQAARRVMPAMYRKEHMWVDGTIDHFHRPLFLYPDEPGCSHLAPDDKRLLTVDCEKRTNYDIICEKEQHLLTNKELMLQPSIHFPDNVGSMILNTSAIAGLACPYGHVTHTFLACDADSTCWGGSTAGEVCGAPLSPLPPSFVCSNGGDRVPYALVCDHRPDCKDSSDEEFCVYTPCRLEAPFECNTQQCVSIENVCDGQVDCFNQADEDNCLTIAHAIPLYLPPPAVINLKKKGEFVAESLAVSGNDTRVACPETHFRCGDDRFYCLPVFLRCNEVFDCPGHEDEADCSTFTCPGFYRCRGSRVCLHSDHLCDSIYQCPQQDDELFCDSPCPDPCVCYGTAFFCAESFDVSNYSQLKFLDAKGSNMTPQIMGNNTMLIRLGLARCRLKHLGSLEFRNLHSLDVSDNDLTTVNHQALALLSNLRFLSLAGNPLSTFLVSTLTLAKQFLSLQELDISRTELVTLNLTSFHQFRSLRSLNLSGNDIQEMINDRYHSLSQIKVLDVRGSPVLLFPQNVFIENGNLERVFADNYKLCCPANLPPSFNPANCHAPQDDISSCDNLLQSNVYRVFLVLFAVLALLGNAVSLGVRTVMGRNKPAQAFGVLVSHLCVSDFLMGVYLAIIGVADHLYQGTYLWDDLAWKRSPFCKLAGFLSLVSSEVSAFIICLITLDRFLVLRFPFSGCRLHRLSAHVACLAAWAVGVVLAAVPLLPPTSHWEFYSQTGICIPLPITRKTFPGQSYSFAIMILLNFVLFLFIAAGQAVIYLSIRTNSMQQPGGAGNKTSQDLTIARRLITVAMSDFLCWFPIGVLGLAASAGHRIPGEVNVAVAILALPLNAALNPFLYTLNMVLERRQKVREERLVAKLTKVPRPL